MKKLLLQYASYNVWANQKLVDCIDNLTDEQIKRKINSSFKSIYATLIHLWDAESIWWQRVKLQERIIVPSENFKGTMAELANSLSQQSKQWKDWVDSTPESSLDHVFQYYNKKKEHFKLPIYQMLHHVFNHGTYHRGQLINMLRQLGVEKVPQTDFSFWITSKK